MAKLHILISGGGIAGAAAAWWIQKRKVASKITIIERAPEPRTSGQAVDIRDAAVDIARQMGLLDTIKAKTTTEEGIEVVYADGKTKAAFPATGDDTHQSITSEYEILRADLARIFYDVTKDLDEVNYVFDECVNEISEKENGKIEVAFKNHLPKTEYDVVIGADGQISKTRRLVFGKGPDGNDFLLPLGQFCCFFTIPRIESDTKWAQWYNSPGGHCALLRPDQYGETRAYLAVSDSNLSRFDEIRKAMSEGSKAQQAWIEKEFEGAGWQTDRIMQGMKSATDFYMCEIAQVKMEPVVKGRVALLGDAGYCPTPISGMGTSSALMGAYALAGELAKSPDNVPHALEQYEKTIRPFITRVQKLPPGAPQIVNPQSPTGIWVLNRVAGFVSQKWVGWIASKVGSVLPPAFHSKEWELPEYPTLE